MISVTAKAKDAAVAFVMQPALRRGTRHCPSDGTCRVYYT